MINRRNLLKAGPAALLPGALLFQEPVWAAAAYPSRPITLVLPTAPGTGSDVLARFVMSHVSSQLGQPILVDNRAGAAGVPGISYAAKAAADGYTLLLLGTGAALSQALFKKPPYDILRDFTMVADCARTEVTALVHKNSRHQNMQDVVQYARQHPRRLTVGVTTFGTVQHMTVELLKQTHKLDFVIVPYKGSPALQAGLLAEDVDVAFDLLPSVLGQLRGGNLRPVATCSAARSALLPQVPTLRELGLLQQEMVSSMLIAAPLQTPQPVVQALSGAIQSVMAKPEIRKGLQEMGYAATGGNPAQTQQYFEGELRKWRTMIAEINMPLQ